MKASACMLAAGVAVLGAAALDATAQQVSPRAAAIESPAAAQTPPAPNPPAAPAPAASVQMAPAQSPASAGVQSAPASAGVRSPGLADPTTEQPKRLGSPLPAPAPLESMQRPAPDVYISVVPPQDSRFSKRLRSGAEEQRVQRARGSGISGLRESSQQRSEQLNSPAPLGMSAPVGMSVE